MEDEMKNRKKRKRKTYFLSKSRANRFLKAEAKRIVEEYDYDPNRYEDGQEPEVTVNGDGFYEYDAEFELEDDWRYSYTKSVRLSISAVKMRILEDPDNKGRLFRVEELSLNDDLYPSDDENEVAGDNAQEDEGSGTGNAEKNVIIID